MEWAKGDPLKAQEMETRLNGTWFHRRLAWREQEIEVAEREKRKARKK